MPFCETIIPQSPGIPIEGLKLSPEANYMAVSRSNHTLEIYNHSQGEWSLLGIFREDSVLAVPLGKIVAMIWHPYLPRRLLLGFFNGIVHFIAFEQYEGMHGIISEKKIDIRLQFLDGNCGGIDCLSQNSAANEFSAVLDKKIFTLRSEPVGNLFCSAALYDAIPPRLTQFRESKPIALCYEQQTTLIGVYPLGIFAVSTMYPNTVSWVLNILPARLILSAALSPDKKLCIGITSYGEADLYSLDKQTFLAKVVHSLGPFRSLSTAIFYDWRSVALASRDSATVNTIPSLRAMSESECKTFRLNGDASLVPIHSLDGALIEGNGQITFLAGRNNMIISLRPESFSGMDIRLNLIDAGRSTDSEIEDQSDTGTSPLYQAQDLASEPVEGSQIEARNDHIFGNGTSEL